MITYEKAKELAKEIDPKVDTYFEYPNAYVFFNSKAEGHEEEDNGIVISKENGQITGYAEYIVYSEYWDKEVQYKLIT